MRLFFLKISRLSGGMALLLRSTYYDRHLIRWRRLRGAMSNHKSTRRDILKSISATAVTAALPGIAAGSASAKALTDASVSGKTGPKPKVIWITIEGVPLSVIGCYGSKLMSTPYIDRLANEGMRFNNSLATNALCAPSRATLRKSWCGNCGPEFRTLGCEVAGDV